MVRPAGEMSSPGEMSSANRGHEHNTNIRPHAQSLPRSLSMPPTSQTPVMPPTSQAPAMPSTPTFDWQCLQQVCANNESAIMQQPTASDRRDDDQDLPQSSSNMTANPAMLSRTQPTPSPFEEPWQGSQVTGQQNSGLSLRRPNGSLAATIARTRYKQQHLLSGPQHVGEQQRQIPVTASSAPGPMRTQYVPSLRWQPYPMNGQRFPPLQRNTQAPLGNPVALVGGFFPQQQQGYGYGQVSPGALQIHMPAEMRRGLPSMQFARSTSSGFSPQALLSSRSHQHANTTHIIPGIHQHRSSQHSTTDQQSPHPQYNVQSRLSGAGIEGGKMQQSPPRPDCDEDVSAKTDIRKDSITPAAAPVPLAPAPRRPVSQQLASQHPATHQPAPHKPALHQPGSQHSASQQPVSQQPAPQHPAPQQPVPQQPAPGERTVSILGLTPQDIADQRFCADCLADPNNATAKYGPDWPNRVVAIKATMMREQAQREEDLWAFHPGRKSDFGEHFGKACSEDVRVPVECEACVRMDIGNRRVLARIHVWMRDGGDRRWGKGKEGNGEERTARWVEEQQKEVQPESGA